MRKKKRRNLIKELINRRDEVIKRAKNLANRQIPQEFMDKDFPDIIEWVIIPHISESYQPYKKVEDDEVRGFSKLMGKLIYALGGKKNEKT